MDSDNYAFANHELLVEVMDTNMKEYEHSNQIARPDYMQCANSEKDKKMENNSTTNENGCECCDMQSASCDEYDANDKATNYKELLNEDHEYIFHTNSLLTTKELIYYNNNINGYDEINNSCMEGMQHPFTSHRKSCENDDSKHISSCNNISVSNTFETSSTQQGSVHEGTQLSDKTRIFCDDVDICELPQNRCDDNDRQVCENINGANTVILSTSSDATAEQKFIDAFEETSRMYSANEDKAKSNCLKEEDEDDLFFINDGMLLQNEEFNEMGSINLCYSDDSNHDVTSDVDMSDLCADEFVNKNGNNNNNNNNNNNDDDDGEDKINYALSNSQILLNKLNSELTQCCQEMHVNDNENVHDEKQQIVLCVERVLPESSLCGKATVHELQDDSSATANLSSPSSIPNTQVDQTNQVNNTVIIVQEQLLTNKVENKLAPAMEELSSNNIYTAIAGRPLFAKPLNFRRFLHQKNIPPHVEQEESTGVFVGQLPSSYSESDIEALLKCIGNENNQIVHVRDVKCHNRERTCAFVVVNASSLGSLLMYTKRVLCDVNAVWVVAPEQASQLPLFVQTMPRDNLRGVPKGALVLEKLTPQVKHKHGPSADHLYSATHSIQTTLPALPLSPLISTNTTTTNTTLAALLSPPPLPNPPPPPPPPPPFRSSPTQLFPASAFPAPSANSLYRSSSYYTTCNASSVQMQNVPSLTTRAQLPSSSSPSSFSSAAQTFSNPLYEMTRSAAASNSAWLINATNTEISNKWMGNTAAATAATSESSLSISHNGTVTQPQLLFNTNSDVGNHLPIYGMAATEVSKYSPLTKPLNVFANANIPVYSSAPLQQQEQIKMNNCRNNIFGNMSYKEALPSYNKNYWSSDASQSKEQEQEQQQQQPQEQQQQQLKMLVKPMELLHAEQEQTMLVPTIVDGRTVFRLNSLYYPASHSPFDNNKSNNLGNIIASRDCQNSTMPAHPTPLIALTPNPTMSAANREIHSFSPYMSNTNNNNELSNQINNLCQTNSVSVDSTTLVESIPVTLLTTNNANTTCNFGQRSNVDVSSSNNTIQSNNLNNNNSFNFSNTCANMPTVADTLLHVDNSQYMFQHVAMTDAANRFTHINDMNKINERNYRNHSNKEITHTAVTLSTVLTGTRCSCGLPLVLSQSGNCASCISCQCVIDSRQIAYWCPLSHVTVCTTCSFIPQLCQSRNKNKN